jgi:predicted dehydrogenase
MSSGKPSEHEHRWTRRKILKAGAVAIGVPAFVPGSVLGLAGVAPASETVRVGMIGCGGRAVGMFPECADVKGFRVVASCDCRLSLAEEYAKQYCGHDKWGVYEDFRKMIDREKLDAVMVETTTHARAWISVLAMQAGMDVYIEKPMSLTIAEGRTMVTAARKNGRVTQVGAQQRSIPINQWAASLVRNGAIGKVHTVLAPNYVGPWRWTEKSSSRTKVSTPGWWGVWSNQAKLWPFDPALLGWARWWDYDGGGLCFGVTGWGTHAYGHINWALGADDTGPVEVTLDEPVAVRESGREFHQETVGGIVIGATGDMDTGKDERHMTKLTGPRAKVTMKFLNGAVVKLHLNADWGPCLGAIFEGEKGKIEIGRNKAASNPKEIVRANGNPGPLRRPETAYHVENWIECIKSRKPCNADVEIGQRATTLCHLVNIVRDIGRVGEALKWNPVTERFTNCDEANKLVDRPRRKGYELPSIA